MRGDDGLWFGFTYRWREDGSEADLLPGEPVEETFLQDGMPRTWHFPGRNECFTCHNDAAGKVLGVKSRQLNGDFFYAATGRTANQLATWNQLGFFAPGLDESALPTVLTSRHQDDGEATLERRARSYLDVNCAHCHQPGAPTQAFFDARLTTPPWFQNWINTTPNNLLGLSDPALVRPGRPDLSLIPVRAASLTPGIAMPPIAKHAVDAEGLKLLNDWITSLDPAIGPVDRVSGTPPSDHRPPTLTFTHLEGAGANVDSTFVFKIEASEPIAGLNSDDFSVENGEITSLTGSGTTWQAAVTPTAPGPGSVTIAADRVTDLHGNANPALAIALPFNHHPVESIEEGGFEDGTLSRWETGGTEVHLVPEAHTGSLAARLGAGSFLIHSRGVNAEERLSFLGSYRSPGVAGSSGEAGITFWDAAGRWLGETVLPLTPSIDFGTFAIEGTAPDEAVAATAWIWSGDGTALTVDDLSLERITAPHAFVESPLLARERTALHLKSGRTLDLTPSGGLSHEPSLAAALTTPHPVFGRGWTANFRNASARHLLPGESGSLVTTLTGPGLFAAKWSLESPDPDGSLILLVDGLEQARGSTGSGWRTVATPIRGPGLHVIEIRAEASLASLTASLSDFRFYPGSPHLQPDLSASSGRGLPVGQGRYQAGGLGQMARLTLGERAHARARVQWINQSNELADGITLFGSSGNRLYRPTYFHLLNGRKNITAGVATELFESDWAAVGHGARFEVEIRKITRRRASPFLGFLRARSLLDPSRADGIRLRVVHR